MTVYFLVKYPYHGKKIDVQAVIEPDRIVSENGDSITFGYDGSNHTSTIAKSDILTIETED